MDDVRWRGLTHQEIYDQVWSGPGHMASADAQGMWVEIRNQLIDIDIDLKAATASLGDGWEGTSAAEALRNLNLLGTWVTQAVNSAATTGAALDDQADYVATMRNNMPPPMAASPLSDLSDPSEVYVLGVPHSFLDDWQAQDAQHAELERQAVQVMETYTSNSASNKPHIHPFATPIAVTPGAVEAGGLAPSATGAGGGVPLPPGAGGVPGAPGGGVGPGGGGAFPVPVTPGSVVPGGVPGGRNVPGPAFPGSGVPGQGVPPPGGPGGGPPQGTVPGRPGPGVPGRPGGGLPPQDPIIRGPAGAPTGGVPGGGRVPGGPFPGSTVPGSTIPGGGPGSTAPGAGSAGPSGSGTAAAGTNAASRSPGPGYIPGAGMGAGVGAQNREHRRPSYLVDDTDAFADDRWFTAAVITPFDVLPRR